MPIFLLPLLSFGAKLFSKEVLGAVWKIVWSPVGAIIFIVIAFGIGDLRGRHVANQKCKAKIERSIAEAKALDKRIADDAALQHEADMAAADARREEAAKRIEAYATTVENKAGCNLDDADVQFLTNGLRDGPPIQRSRPEPAGRPPDRVVPGPKAPAKKR